MPDYSATEDEKADAADQYFFIGLNFTTENRSLCCSRGIIDVQPKTFIAGLLDVTSLVEY
jgi:hypothetical protein